ncbi:MFS transporter [Halomarina salina]|uniref:MFS transporter n=1 Tax=Halomarina salina TaxID=1872699 RepID=A0ABD5RTJ0_9EURY|nr:MFS transporter [Halomarina salina]
MTSSPDTVTSPGRSEGTQNRNPRATWGLVVGASLISTGLAAYEIVPASVTPVIRDSLGIDATAAGLLVGTMFGTAVVASLPTGALLDRMNTRTAMVLAVFLLCIAGGWGWVAGQSGNYRQLILSRILGGIAYVAVWNAGIDIVSRSVGPDRRATAVGVFTASGPVGFALGQGGGPLVASHFGWPAIFIVFVGIALLGLLIFWPTSRGLGHSSGDAPTLSEFGAVLRNREVWLVGGLGFAGYALYLFVNSWGGPYLTQELGLSVTVSGALVAVFPAIGIFARTSSGLLSDRVFAGRRRPIVLGSFVVATPLVLSFTWLQSIPVLVAILLVTGFAVQLTLGLSFTYVRELVTEQVAATAVAFQTSVGLAGAFVAPIIGGRLVDTGGFEVAFLVAGGVAIGGIVLAWMAPESAPTRG